MERKFHALRVMSDVHRALSTMRSKSRLKVETDEEKKARFSEECSWYEYLALFSISIKTLKEKENTKVCCLIQGRKGHLVISSPPQMRLTIPKLYFKMNTNGESEVAWCQIIREEEIVE